MSQATLTQAQEAEMRNVKAWFPYRIVFGVIDKDTKEFSVYAKTTKHTLNKMMRAGHTVFQFQTGSAQ